MGDKGSQGEKILTLPGERVGALVLDAASVDSLLQINRAGERRLECRVARRHPPWSSIALRPAERPKSPGLHCRRPAPPGFPGWQTHNRNAGPRARFRPPSPPRRRGAPAPGPSFDSDLPDLGLRLAVVVGPAKGDFAALCGDR